MKKQKRINRCGKYRRMSWKNGRISRAIPEGEYQKRQRAVKKRRTTKAKKELAKIAVGQLPVIGKISTGRDIVKNVKVLIKKGKK